MLEFADELEDDFEFEDFVVLALLREGFFTSCSSGGDDNGSKAGREEKEGDEKDNEADSFWRKKTLQDYVNLKTELEKLIKDKDKPAITVRLLKAEA